MGNETGTFDDEEREMIDSVFAFDDRTARELIGPEKRCVYPGHRKSLLKR